MKRKEILIILVIFILAAIIYFTAQKEIESSENKDFNYGENNNLKGDESCSGLEKDKQENCCEILHSKDIRIQCVGEWKYNETTKKCSFMCTSDLLP